MQWRTMSGATFAGAPGGSAPLPSRHLALPRRRGPHTAHPLTRALPPCAAAGCSAGSPGGAILDCATLCSTVSSDYCTNPQTAELAITPGQAVASLTVLAPVGPEDELATQNIFGGLSIQLSGSNTPCTGGSLSNSAATLKPLGVYTALGSGLLCSFDIQVRQRERLRPTTAADAAPVPPAPPGRSPHCHPSLPFPALQYAQGGWRTENALIPGINSFSAIFMANIQSVSVQDIQARRCGLWCACSLHAGRSMQGREESTRRPRPASPCMQAPLAPLTAVPDAGRRIDPAAPCQHCPGHPDQRGRGARRPPRQCKRAAGAARAATDSRRLPPPAEPQPERPSPDQREPYHILQPAEPGHQRLHPVQRQLQHHHLGHPVSASACAWPALMAPPQLTDCLVVPGFAQIPVHHPKQ